MLPLQGVTVVAVEQAVAAPFATRQLADLGARVVKIERPGSGDFARAYDSTVKGMASHFVWTNRSKESLTLDLKRPEAAEALRRLVARADVFIHNLAPGAISRLGFGSAELRVAHPRLVTCEISGYGASGPYRDKKAYDLLVQSEAGLLSITGTDATPSKVGISIADIAAGMYAYSGILAALLRRERTGEGATLDVSLFDASPSGWAIPRITPSTAARRRRGPEPGTRRLRRTDRIAAGDGRAVYFGIQNEREWARFCERVLDRPELAGDPRFSSNASRVEHQAALDGIIAASFAPSHCGRGARAPRRRRHCQRPHEHRARVYRPSAAGRPQPLA